MSAAKYSLYILSGVLVIYVTDFLLGSGQSERYKLIFTVIGTVSIVEGLLGLYELRKSDGEESANSYNEELYNDTDDSLKKKIWSYLKKFI